MKDETDLGNRLERDDIEREVFIHEMVEKKLDWLGVLAVEIWCNGHIMRGKTRREVIEMLSHSSIHSISQLEHMKQKWKDFLWNGEKK